MNNKKSKTETLKDFEKNYISKQAVELTTKPATNAKHGKFRVPSANAMDQLDTVLFPLNKFKL